MLATCPNFPDHKRFYTTAHVMEEWLVDENGNYIEVSQESMEVVHGANPGNVWICHDCGAVAIVLDK